MSNQYYPALDETLFFRVLPNGLKVFVNPRPGASKKLCYFAVDFGAIHRGFTFEGAHHQVPDGVAHYLEHVKFDLPGRDVTGEFAALGVQVNAFTSYDMTAYHISCTENFQQGLALLLEFVSTPHFTRENVDKEQGIIAQEIGMSADDPGGRCFENLMQALYEQHPIRVPILGTEASIATITPEILTLCHRAFYTPENMILCAVGDVDAEEICATAQAILGNERRPVGVKDPIPTEEMVAREHRITDRMEVAMPLFSMAIKTTCPELGEPAIRREMVGDLAAEALFGESSQLYMELYDRGLIDSSFGGGFDTVDGCAMVSCSGDSPDPEGVCREILDRAELLAAQGISPEALLRMKRSAMGRRVQDLDSFGTTCFRLCAYEMSGFDYFRFPELLADIQPQEIQAFIHQAIKPEACSLSIIYPMKENEV